MKRHYSIALVGAYVNGRIQFNIENIDNWGRWVIVIASAIMIASAVAVVMRKGWWRRGDFVLRFGLGVSAGVGGLTGSRGALSLVLLVLVAYPLYWFLRGRTSWSVWLLAAVSALLCIRVTLSDYVPDESYSRSEAGGFFRFEAGWPEDGRDIEHRLRWKSVHGGWPAAIWVDVAEWCDGDARISGRVVSVGSGSIEGVLGVMEGAIGVERSLGLGYRRSASAMVFGLGGWDRVVGRAVAVRFRRESASGGCAFVALRWAAGASFGFGASAVVDGHSRVAGVFDVRTGSIRPGVLLVRFSSEESVVEGREYLE